MKSNAESINQESLFNPSNVFHHPIKGQAFFATRKGIAADLTNRDEIVLSRISTEHRQRNFVEFTLAGLAELCNMSKRTLQRAIDSLKGFGLIKIERQFNRLRFFLTNFYHRFSEIKEAAGCIGLANILDWYIKMKARFIESQNPEQTHDQIEKRVAILTTLDDKMATPSIIDNKEIIETAKSELIPDSVSEDPPDNQKTEPSAVLFSDSVKEKIDTCVNLIEESCEAILDLPAKRGIPFNPMEATGWAIKKGYHPQAISYTLKAMSNPMAWNDMENPFGWFRAVVRCSSRNFNEQDHLKLSDERKELEKGFIAKLGNIFSKIRLGRMI